MSTIDPVPPGYPSVSPHLGCADAAREIDFLRRALGARERARTACPYGSGKIVHAELQVGSSLVMLADAHSELGTVSPAQVGGTPVGFFLYVPDVDAAFARATAAGGKTLQAPEDAFWGDRVGVFLDPEGFRWTLASRIEELSPEQIGERMRRMAETAGAR